MVNRFYYLTSVSMLASTVMIQAGQAMDDEGKSSTSSLKQISNSLFYDDKGLSGGADSRKTAMDKIHKDAWNIGTTAVGEKIDTFVKIAKQVHSGQYDGLAGEAIELLIANLAGETQKNLFGNSSKDFDPEVFKKGLTKASNALVNEFWKHLSRNNDIYGELPDGTRVTIYNRSLFKMFADKCFPEIPVVTGLATAILDNNTLKTFIQTKLTETIVDHLLGFFKGQKINLKEALGKQAEQLGKKAAAAGYSMIHDESSVDYGKLWEYLRPHISYHLRNYLIPNLKKAKNAIITKTESELWYATVPTVGALSYSTTGILGGMVGTVAAHSYFKATKNFASQYVDDRLDLFAHTLIPYSREEHALYALNNAPEDIEKGLAFEDYQLQAKLNSQTYIGGVLKSIGETSGISNILNSIFGNKAPVDLLQIKYCMAEEQEQAYRQLTRLKETNPEKAEKILRNLKKHPSYEQKIKFLKHLRKVTVDEVQAEEKQAQNYSKASKKVIQNIRGTAAILVKQLCKQYDQFSASKEPIYAELEEEILSHSIESQDYLIQWIKTHRDELKEFICKFAETTKGEDFFEVNTIQSIDENDNAEAPQKFANKATIKAFVKQLLDTCIQEYIDASIKTHGKKYQADIEALSSKTLTERMDQAQIVNLHKRLSSRKEIPFYEFLPQEVMLRILDLLDDKKLTELAIVSHPLYRLCLNTIDKRKSERIFQFNGLSQEERDYFDEYRHDLLIIENAYRTLKFNHLGYTLFEILKDHLEQKQVLEKIKNTIKSSSDALPDQDALKNKLLELIANDEDYKEVNGMIKKVIGNNYPDAKKVYDAERSLLVEEATKQLSSEQNVSSEAPLPLEASMNGNPKTTKATKGWGFSSFRGTTTANSSSSSSVPQLTEGMVEQKFNDAQKSFVAHDKSSKGVQSFKLLEVMNDMAFENHSGLSLKDFIGIHKEILGTKLTKLSDVDKKFFTQYAKSINFDKLSGPVYSNRLFYGVELIEAIRESNRSYVKKLFDLL